MNFDDTETEAAFRLEARAWLAANAEPATRAEVGHVAPLFDDDGEAAREADWVARCRAWQRCKADARYVAINWPEAVGGRGGTLMEELIFAEEETGFDVATGAFAITMGMVAPTLLAHGTVDQRAHVNAILRGDEIWCQLFSEPGAGSDLAAIATSATRDGDDWVITGQKVWTSGAQYADWGYLLARSDPSVPKHAGLTAFILPMTAAGVVVRPLRQMTGGASFNEVFLDEVRLPDTARLGDVGAGWRVAITTLMNERMSVAGNSYVIRNLAAVHELARRAGRSAEPVVRQRLAGLHIQSEIIRYIGLRALTSLSRGAPPGPEGSIGKLAFVQALRAMGDLAIDLAGMEGQLDSSEAQLVLGTPGARLGGGTDETMRNIIGERVLGLPSEPRVDRVARPIGASS